MRCHFLSALGTQATMTLQNGVIFDLAVKAQKKAEALIQLAEDHKKHLALEHEAIKEASPEVQEPADKETPDMDETPAEEEEVVAEEDAQQEEATTFEEEDEEVPIQELTGLSPEVLKTLVDNGFETIAELSVTPLDELIAMEGVDEEMGKSILEQVKQRLENTENV